MQKFGLQRNQSSQLSLIEKEIIKEQASSLGRAGKKLRLSLENYEKQRHRNQNPEVSLRLIKEISNNVWELILQREFVGFIDGNLKWIRENYVIPDDAINLLGSSA